MTKHSIIKERLESGAGTDTIVEAVLAEYPDADPRKVKRHIYSIRSSRKKASTATVEGAKKTSKKKPKKK